jgi:general nucleoside transport system permease protein
VIPGRCRGGIWTVLANLAVLAALFVGTQFLARELGAEPASASTAPWSGDVILVASGLLFLGLAFLLPLHAGLLNLAIHAQLLAGFAAGSLVPLYLDLIPGAEASLALAVGAAAGLLTGIVVAWLKRRFAIHEILSGLLLGAAMIFVPRGAGVGPVAPPSLTIGLGSLTGALPWASGLRLPPSLVLACGMLLLVLGLTLGFLASHFLRVSVRGFDLRAVGSNPLAAVAAGVDVDGIQTLMMAIGGACAGLAGALQLWSEPAVALERWPLPLGVAGLSVAFLGAGYVRGALLVALGLAVWLNLPGSAEVLGSPEWIAGAALLLVLPSLWVLPRLLPDQGAPRTIWRTRHRETL